jgi:hypothetical protein
MWDKMTDFNLGEDRFPVSTDNITQFTFKLKYAFKEIMLFDWIDYPGGVIKGSSTMRGQVMDSLKESSCIFLCVDGYAFSEDVDDPVEHLVMQGAATYTKLLNEFEDKNGFIPPIVIIITKYDMCAKGSEMKKIIEEAFNALFARDGGHNRLVTIIPVTLGKKIAQNGFRGKLEPININLPISFAIWSIITGNIRKVDELRSSIYNNLSDANRGLFKIFRKDKINNLKKLSTDAEFVYDKLCQDADKLFEELSSAKKFPVYLNGKEITLLDLTAR